MKNIQILSSTTQMNSQNKTEEINQTLHCDEHKSGRQIRKSGKNRKWGKIFKART